MSSNMDSSSKKAKELNRPQLNSSKYEAYSIQKAIERLANIRPEVETEILAAAAKSSGNVVQDKRRPSSALTESSGSKVIPSAATVQLVRSNRVFGPATKKLNLPSSGKLYRDLTDIRVPPNQIKLKRVPQCEKKIDPSPCLQDYIQPQYCSIKPERDYVSTYGVCKIDEPSKIIGTSNCVDEEFEDDYYLIRSEGSFTYG